MHTHPPSKEVKRLSNLLSQEGEAFADFFGMIGTRTPS
jgi:hypothetical protein